MTSLPQGYGGFTGFHFAMLMVMLLQQKQLNRLMSSYQIIRIVLQHLGKCNLSNQALLFSRTNRGSSLLIVGTANSALE